MVTAQSVGRVLVQRKTNLNLNTSLAHLVPSHLRDTKSILLLNRFLQLVVCFTVNVLGCVHTCAGAKTIRDRASVHT